MSKTKLIDSRKTIKISLPSYPDSEVELYNDLLTSQVEALNDLEKDYDRGIQTIVFLIKSWSFVNEKEEPLEADKENLSKLPAKDFTLLMEKSGELLNVVSAKKEKSSSK